MQVSREKRQIKYLSLLRVEGKVPNVDTLWLGSHESHSASTSRESNALCEFRPGLRFLDDTADRGD